MHNKFCINHKLVMALLLLLILFSAACKPIAAPLQSEGAGKITKLKAVVLPYISSGPLFIAQEEGFFKEQDLEVEFVRMDSGAGPLPALAQGEIDVAASGPTAGLLNTIGQGGSIRIVADKGNLDPAGCTYLALLARPDWIASDPLAHTNALPGLHVSIDPTNFEAFMLEGLLRDSGLTLDDLTIEDVAPLALAEAVENQAVDLISVGEPWVTRLLDTDKVAVWQSGAAIAPHLQFGVILFGKKLIEGDPAVGARFMAAYLKGVRQYNEGQTARNVVIMAQYTNLDPDLLQRACWPTMAVDGLVNMDSVLAFEEWAIGKGLVDHPVSAEQIWDGSFITAATERLGLVTP